MNKNMTNRFSDTLFVFGCKDTLKKKKNTILQSRVYIFPVFRLIAIEKSSALNWLKVTFLFFLFLCIIFFSYFKF